MKDRTKLEGYIKRLNNLNKQMTSCCKEIGYPCDKCILQEEKGGCIKNYIEISLSILKENRGKADKNDEENKNL